MEVATSAWQARLMQARRCLLICGAWKKRRRKWGARGKEGGAWWGELGTSGKVWSPAFLSCLAFALPLSQWLVTLGAVALQLYVHHYGGGFEFLVGSGAELRGSFTRKPLPEPYAQLVNGTEVAGFAKRMTNIQLINTGDLQCDAHCYGAWLVPVCVCVRAHGCAF